MYITWTTFFNPSNLIAQDKTTVQCRRGHPSHPFVIHRTAFCFSLHCLCLSSIQVVRGLNVPLWSRVSLLHTAMPAAQLPTPPTPPPHPECRQVQVVPGPTVQNLFSRMLSACAPGAEYATGAEAPPGMIFGARAPPTAAAMHGRHLDDASSASLASHPQRNRKKIETEINK